MAVLKFNNFFSACRNEVGFIYDKIIFEPLTPLPEIAKTLSEFFHSHVRNIFRSPV
jgi:hypothetical protein